MISSNNLCSDQNCSKPYRDPNTFLQKASYFYQLSQPKPNHFVENLEKTNRCPIQNLPTCKQNCDYMESQPSFKTYYDPDTGRYYAIKKIYPNPLDYAMGQTNNYYYQTEELCYRAVKKPGTDYYKPSYSKYN